MREKLPPTEPRLTVEIKYKRPIALGDVSVSFEALASEYKAWAEENETGQVVGDLGLYIESLKGGSIVATLVALSPLYLPFLESANTVVEFAKFLKVSYEALLGKHDKQELSRHSYKNLSAIVEPVAKDGSAQINLSAVVNGDVHYHLHLTSVEANAAQNNARRELTAGGEAVTGIHQNVVLYLYQARNVPSTSVGDKGVIESLHTGPVRLAFSEGAKKSFVLDVSDNPFKSAWVVDVQVETVNGKPALYKILEIHDRIDRPEAA